VNRESAIVKTAESRKPKAESKYRLQEVIRRATGKLVTGDR
jgi:hypothetical protein